ncbi:MAG: FtsX-like permease family protein, partial [Gemmatimonadota bacterium]
RRLFPDGQDPLGQRLRFGPVSPWMPIVAVVADARNRSLTDEPRPELYLPGLGSWASMGFATEITIVVRASGDPLALAGPIRRIITEAAPDIAIYNQFTLDAIVQDAGARMAITTRLMSGYALAALLLALAGTYAVLSFLVTQRERELAVRIALGAKPAEIVKLVGRESLLVVGAGILIGLAGALSSARLLAGLLYGVGPFNLGVLGLVVLGAVFTGIAGAMVPAWRATRIDPIVALRGGG